MTLLEAQALVRRLQDGRVLLDDISLALAAGDRLAIAGAAGSGKSLLLRALAQLDPHDAGTIRWRGRQVADTEIPAFRSQIVYLPQSPTLVEGNVERNVRLPCSLAIHEGRPFDRAGCVDRLQALGKDESFLDQPVAALSGGERQIVALVRLFQIEPRVVLLDEPTAALDPETTRHAERLILGWLEGDPARRACAWVSHDDRQARGVSNRQARMDRGRLAEVN